MRDDTGPGSTDFAAGVVVALVEFLSRVMPSRSWRRREAASSGSGRNTNVENYGRRRLAENP
jgi:hypothetical protein